MSSDVAELRRSRWIEPCRWLLTFAVVYAAVSFTAFRLRHPWLTETQVLLHTPDALTWRTVEKP